MKNVSPVVYFKQKCPVNKNKQGQPGRPNDEYKDCASGSSSGLEGK